MPNRYATEQEREQAIRERAYAIWQSEGCPNGRDQEHWRLAADGLAYEELVSNVENDPNLVTVKTNARKTKASKMTSRSRAAAKRR